MARVTKKRKPQAAPATPLDALMREHLLALQVQNYSEFTVKGREGHIRFFLEWLKERGITDPIDVTRPVLERYQRHLFYARKKNGEPLSFSSQHARLVPLRVWFRWMTKQNRILHNPASELELPRLGRSLPKVILSAQEVEQIMTLCDIEEPIGLRDRAILELLYSTGMRRLEIVRVKLYDLQLDRGLILINQGKGSKDRYVPVGARAAAWLQKYIVEGRPQLAAEPDDMTVFLTAQGEPFSRDHLTFVVKERIAAAKLGKGGACHLFRHTMATLMHENGADIRHIQAILGHEDIKTTQIYTQVAIRALQQIHAATHPAEARSVTQAARTAAEREGLLAALTAEEDDDQEPGS
ncbi:MAG TPA: site-specific tyrosine recombinase XerC [Edaphobacter sp.]|uniref:site-specific tyrosine recombinase XerC n=1 Tax=Edaphobacter sp. TaxID=1934404 RepID=UPI002CCF364E|nr:site-specific tyrosine recombinase XerC [Edaphobacter sp.]HUZ95956.1 site-specific tyrosine recombinase XerC [Edaphobacter sp.]